MEMNTQTMRKLISLGYMAKENELDMDDVLEMVEKGFIAVHPQRQMVLS